MSKCEIQNANAPENKVCKNYFFLAVANIDGIAGM
jgi:hypothetical protein